MVKRKEWDIFWQLIFFFFLDMLASKRNYLFEWELFNSWPKDWFREFIAAIFRNLMIFRYICATSFLRKRFKDTINPLQLSVEKRQFFNQNNQWLNNIIYHLNRQLTVVLNSIICFSVRFCDNLLFVLKMHFQVFSFASKKAQGFSSDRILMSLLSVLFHLPNHVSVFWNFNF